MWFFIWAVLSAVVLGATLWSYLVLRQQKKAWQAFAKRHSLDYKPGTLMGAPFMAGKIGAHNIAFFTGLQQTNDARGQRFLTVIELDLRVGLPTAAAMGTKDAAGFINALRLDHDFRPEEGDENWRPDYVARTRDVHKLKAYLTPERKAALHNLFSMNNVVILYFFDEQDCILRLETPDPLRDDRKMEKIVNRILGNVARLVPTDAEKAEAEQERARQYHAAREEPPAPAAAPEAPAAASTGKKKREPYLEPRADKKEQP